jgi:hypothetical protein
VELTDQSDTAGCPVTLATRKFSLSQEGGNGKGNNNSQTDGTPADEFLKKRLIRRVKSTIVTCTVAVEEVNSMTV